MLRAEQYIEPEQLQRWAQSWDERIYMDYYENQIQDRIKRTKVRSSMEETIVKIKKLCADMGEEVHFHEFLQLMNRLIFNCYFKVGNSALRMANFYEEILVPADQHTRNQMFAFEHNRRKAGQLQIHSQNQQIGHLGEPSDMFHLIFDACFSTEEELFDEDAHLLDDEAGHSPPLGAAPDETMLTLKIWKPELVDQGMDHFVDLFLFHCSTKLGLNFKRASFEAPLDKRIDALDEDIQVRRFQAEKMPLLYFNSAAHNLPPAIVFMSYYHVLSYFFDRAVHVVIREKMQNMFEHDTLEEEKHLRRMAKAVYSLKDSFSEKESLTLVLKRVADSEALVSWFEEKPFRRRWFTQTPERLKELPALSLTSEKELLHTLVERIYSIKATLNDEHEKQEHFIFQPQLDPAVLQKEVPLLKFLAARAIEIWSNTRKA